MKTGRKMKRAVLAAVVALFVAAPAASAAPDGQWEPRFKLPDNFAIHDVVMPTGKVLTWSYPFNKTPFTGETQTGVGVASVWDPEKGTGADAFTRVNPPAALNIWCSGQSLLADGRVLVTGGNLKYSEDLNHDGDTDDPGEYFRGLNTVAIFNPFVFDTEKAKGAAGDVGKAWEILDERMDHGRWYPTQVLLKDGRTLIFSGLTEHGDRDNNPDVEVFDPSKPKGQQISVIGTRGPTDVTQASPVPPNGAAYPHVFLMPSSNVLLVGPRQYDSWLLPGAGANPFTSLTGWKDVPDDPTIKDRYAGTAVLDPGLSEADHSHEYVHHIGGSDGGGGIDDTPLASEVHVHEDSAPTGAGGLNIGRAHHNTVIMPDGSMATFGGGVGVANYGNGQWQAGRPGTNEADQRRHVELWNPVTQVWRLGPASDEDRAYHSTALLMPDGRVFTGGDDTNGGVCQDAGQIYQPWYYTESRPTLGLTIDTQSGQYKVGSGIVKAVVVSPAAVTHSVDMNQRRVEVPLDAAGRITLPANRNLIVPGWHMVFGFNAAGVPSMATWIKVTNPGQALEIGHVTAVAPATQPVSIEACPTPGGGIQPPAADPPLNPGLPFTPPLSNPEVKPLPKKYGRWDLRREPLNEDCGNLDTPKNEFKTLRSKRGINYFNVKVFRSNCKTAILLITDKKLKGYKYGRRKARKFDCLSKATTNPSIGKHIRTMSCRKGSNIIYWQIQTRR